MLGADPRAGGTQLAGGPLELGVGAFAAAALAVAPAIADLAVLGDAGGVVHGAVAGGARVVLVADAHPALAPPVSW